MWTFVYKYDTEGYLTKYKSRIVARGDLQRNGLQDTYAATLFAKTFRAMMAIAAYFGLEAYQWDIKNAFVNAVMDEEVFVEFPDGFKQPTQSDTPTKSTVRSKTVTETLAENLYRKLGELGLKQALEDSCVFSGKPSSLGSARRRKGKKSKSARLCRNHLLAAFDGMRSRDEHAILTTADFPIRSAPTPKVTNQRFVMNLMQDSDGSIVNTDIEISDGTDQEDSDGTRDPWPVAPIQNGYRVLGS